MPCGTNSGAKTGNGAYDGHVADRFKFSAHKNEPNISARKISPSIAQPMTTLRTDRTRGRPMGAEHKHDVSRDEHYFSHAGAKKAFKSALSYQIACQPTRSPTVRMLAEGDWRQEEGPLATGDRALVGVDSSAPDVGGAAASENDASRFTTTVGVVTGASPTPLRVCITPSSSRWGHVTGELARVSEPRFGSCCLTPASGEFSGFVLSRTAVPVPFWDVAQPDPSLLLTGLWTMSGARSRAACPGGFPNTVVES